MYGGGRLEGWVKCGHGVFFDRLPHFRSHGFVAVQQSAKPYAARPHFQKPNVVLSVGGEHSCCPFVVGLSVSIITIPRPDLTSSRIGYFFRFQRTRRLVLTLLTSTPLLYTATRILQAALVIFFDFFLRVLQTVDTQQLVSLKKVMGAYLRLAYIRYTRARVRWRWRSVVAVAVAVGRGGGVVPGGRSPHMIL